MKMQTVLTSHQNIFNLIQGSRLQLGLGTNNFTNSTNLLQNLIFLNTCIYMDNSILKQAEVDKNESCIN